jgi:phage protein D
MAAVTLVQAARKYGDFYVPRFEIVASGSGLDARVLRDVTQVTYNDSISEIDSFDITVANWDTDPKQRRFRYVGAEKSVMGATPLERLFNPCAGEFELKLGYGTELMPMTRGSTTTLEPTFPSGAAPTLTVRLLNVLHKLRTKQHRDHWPNQRVASGQMKISKIAQDIGTRKIDGERFPLEIRVSKKAIGEEPLLDYLAQDNQHDIDFLLLEARKIGYVVYVDREKQGNKDKEFLYFGPSDDQHPGVPRTQYELVWGVSLIDFTPKLQTANQVRSVTVKGRNRQTNKAIVEKATLDDVDINSDLKPLLTQAGCQPREDTVVNEPMYNEAQAKRRAKALLSDKLKQMVEATGTSVGLPDMRAGQQLLIRGLGARFSGTYFVTKTTHTLNDSGYITKFTARREAALPDGGSAPVGAAP